MRPRLPLRRGVATAVAVAAERKSEFVRTQELAERLGVTEATINNWGRSKKLPGSFLIGQIRFFRRDIVEAFLGAADESTGDAPQ